MLENLVRALEANIPTVSPILIKHIVQEYMVYDSKNYLPKIVDT